MMNLVHDGEPFAPQRMAVAVDSVEAFIYSKIDTHLSIQGQT